MQLYPESNLPRQYAPKEVAKHLNDERYMAGFRQWLRSRGIFPAPPWRIKEDRISVEALASQAGCFFLLAIDLDAESVMLTAMSKS
jgi:hypothetical protein